MKKEIVWKRFFDEIPECQWIWKTDGKTIILEEITDQPMGRGPLLWAKANIEYPEIPDIELQ